jgi:hypothetical protein
VSESSVTSAAKLRGWLVWTATALVVAAGDALVGWHHATGAPHGYPFWLETSLGTTFAGVLAGLLISRRPGHPIARLSLVVGSASAAQLLGGSVASAATAAALPRSLVVPAAYLSAIGQSAILGGLVLVLLLVPTGHPLSRRWLPLCWLSVVTVLCMSTADLVSPGLGGAAYLRDNPLADVGGHGFDVALANIGGAAAVVMALAGVVALLRRLRRSTGEERQQVKWIVAAGIAAVTAVLLNTAASIWLHTPDQVGSVVWGCAGAAVPAATTAAILRYRLYDIDRVVSRAVTYLVVTGVVAGFYIGVIALVETGLGFSSSIAVAASTLAAAAAFQPLRRRVQRGIDRRFDRAAYDARRTVERFSASMRDKADVDAVCDDLLTTVTFAVAPSAASVWLDHG